jgi:hypothetical protein
MRMRAIHQSLSSQQTDSQVPGVGQDCKVRVKLCFQDALAQLRREVALLNLALQKWHELGGSV